MNENLYFRTILTYVTFVTVGVARLMHDSTYFIFVLPLGTFILAYVLIKCHFEAFVALSRSSEFFCRNQILRFAPVCKIGQSGFDKLALMLLLFDSQLYYGLFYKQSTFSKISFFGF
jgi:hypothetical protein